MSKITSSILVIGNEILSGRTQDINVQFMANKLSKIGIKLEEVRIIPDIQIQIIDNINLLRKKHNYVFTTGGIGPTHDDITSESVSKAFNRKYIINKEAYKLLESYYTKGKINEGRLKMTKMPEGSKIIKNPLTIAPGFYIENVYVFPGVPIIMQKMFQQVLKKLKSNKPIISKTINTNIYESIIAKSLTRIQNKYNNCEIGSYPRFDFKKKEANVNIVVSGNSIKNIKSAVNDIITSIKKLGGKVKQH